MKQVCVIGLSQFGAHLARQLVKMGCEVLAIDSVESKIDEIRDEVHRAIVGDARNFQMLDSVLSNKVDSAVLSLGDINIEPSILCALNLRRLDIADIRSTARDEEHAQILRAVGATEIIFPEQDTATRVARRLANPDLRDMFPLDEDYRIMEIGAPPPLHHKSLAALDLRKEFDLLVLAVRRHGAQRFSFLPGASTVIEPEDVLMVLGRELDLARFAGLG